ncbi:hypothetical protein [Lysinibacillus piscis]|uniref:ABC transporter permease n=1 Tax=Lysinibacillus piscis TaxID=2518931 RepID=A0ABQ5NLK2_9BACI|nr:hypothetical protein [Lysinibacillus sp. KH24]GLC89235.1 hypothetical protein LYSBPC_23620 [Lysinibacillus sp. KH24]
MNKKICNNELIKAFYNKNITMLILILLSLYSLDLLFSTVENDLETNVYDLLMKITSFLPLSYIMIPMFLIVITVHFSVGDVQNYIAFRFKSKRQWYQMNVIFITQLAATFSLTVVGIMLLQSVFVFSFKNTWSEFALNYYENYAIFLSNYSPILYSIVTIILLWLILFLLGLIYFLIFLWTRKTMISFMAVFILNLLNISITLGKFDGLSRYLFTDHVNILQYIYRFNISQQQFPYSIVLYWILLIFIMYLIGLFTVNRVDILLEKESKNHVS